MFQLSFARIISVIIFLYSLVVMIGWIFDIPALTGIFPNQTHMQFITAFCFFLSSIALFFIDMSGRGEKEIPLLVLPATSMLTLLVMATTLAAGIFAVRTGITDLFLGNGIVFENVIPGVPSIMTIVGFVLFSIASILALNDLAHLKPEIIYLGVLLIITGVLPLFGYLLNVPILYYRFSAVVTPMALNTAILFILLGLGLVGVEKNQKDKQSLSEYHEN